MPAFGSAWQAFCVAIVVTWSLNPAEQLAASRMPDRSDLVGGIWTGLVILVVNSIVLGAAAYNTHQRSPGGSRAHVIYAVLAAAGPLAAAFMLIAFREQVF
ncbi:hypothetical protein GCM10022419_127350 [Nonomuraea rosea]|uniref:Integral membrane protein n=1 Tax=Nonomuraea rosea TaxID=638574 RepID=A0ABP6ZYH8_9ACTN